MKKVILALVLSLVCAGAWAQLNVKSKTPSAEKIDMALDSKATLARFQNIGYVIAFVSSNRYDSAAPFRLGDDLKSAIQTLDDLIGLYDSLGTDWLTVEPWPKSSCDIRCLEQPGWLRLQFSKQAGHCDVAKKDLEKFRSELQKLLMEESAKVENVE